jgi:dolichyl-diphosphooligosaccharide--protein glycosyltransferase
MQRLRTAALLFVVVACGVGARSLRWNEVVRGDTFVFPLGDSYYHLRRAEFTLENPGRVLLFDPLVNHPDGSWIPWPPLHTLLLVGGATLLGGTRDALERAAAVYPVAIGALTALPVFGAARVLAGPGIALLAAALAALLPASIAYSDFGNADHHATVAFFGALWLWGALLALRSEPPPPRLLAGGLAMLGRLGVIFTWPGSLLYVLVADGGCAGVAILRGRARVLQDLALGLGACAVLVLIALPGLGPPVGGVYSTFALSYLHPPSMLALAAVAGGSAWLERRAPQRSTFARIGASTGVALAAGAALLALPGLIDSLGIAAGFVGKQDTWAAYNAEQRPLFDTARPRFWLRPLWYYGGFGYAIPLLPLALLLRARDRRAGDSALLLALWTAALGALAGMQLRYGSDYAPAACVGFAVAVDEVGRRVGGARRARAAATIAVLLGAGPIVAQHVAQAGVLLRNQRAPAPATDPLLATPTGTLYRFAEELRRLTPETAGYLDPSARPEYAILAPANVGHLIHYVAHRATPADNFGPYSASRFFHLAQRFFRVRTERRALSIADALGARYVMTLEYGPVDWRGLTQRLHREDGSGSPETPNWGAFRLVSEGPRGGQPLASIYGGSAPSDVAPFKLFERVAGAVLEVPAAPGEMAHAGIGLRTNLGRAIYYEAYGKAGDDGVARLRVPYAGDAATPTRTTGPWEVSVAGGASVTVEIPEAAVLEGRAIRVPRPPVEPAP